jgi:outer membrane protein OmpA-like peptidoglycan-associated protein
MQAENKWVVAGDVPFPEGGYQLSAAGQQALSQYVPRLQSLQSAKVVVYGYKGGRRGSLLGRGAGALLSCV